MIGMKESAHSKSDGKQDRVIVRVKGEAMESDIVFKRPVKSVFFNHSVFRVSTIASFGNVFIHPLDE